MNRPDFLTAGALVLGTGVPRPLAQPKFVDNPFTPGVASGDPWPESIVLWTRLLRTEMPHAAIPVRWRVAHDEKMTRTVRAGTALAEPEWAHSVHAEVHGLAPDRWYW